MRDFISIYKKLRTDLWRQNGTGRLIKAGNTIPYITTTSANLFIFSEIYTEFP